MRQSLLRRVGGRSIPTLALVVVALLAAWMGLRDGGYFARDWGGPVLVLAALAVVVSAAGGLPGTRHKGAFVASVLLGLYAAWTFASLVWSPSRGDAWQGTGLTLLYALTFLVAVALVARGASRRWVMAASVVGPAGVAALTLAGLKAHLPYLFEDNRLIGTVGYYNGEAAFLLLPFWVSIYLGGSPRVNPALRGLSLAGAVVCLDLAVLAQSRGAMVAMAASLPVFFLLSGQRLRGLLALAPVAGALYLTFPGLNDVYLAFLRQQAPAAILGEVLPTVWLGALAVGAYGVIWGLVDRRWSVPVGMARLFGGAAAAAAVIFVVAGLVSLAGNSGAALAREKWEAFKTDDTAGHQQSRYLSASGTGRLELWRVAWKDFEAHPIFGVGTHNYEATYYQMRREDVGAVRQPHALPLEVLGERGLVGAGLLFGFGAACVGAGLRGRFGRLNPEGRAQVGALTAAVAYWFVHSSAEWFWQVPAITLPAVLYLALLAAPWGRIPKRKPSDPALMSRIVCAGAALLALVVLLPVCVADRELARSYAAGMGTEQALDVVDRAQRYDPLNPRLPLREAELAIAGGDWERVEHAYQRAIRLNPEHYVPYEFLAAFYEQRGETRKAVTLRREASALNPLLAGRDGSGEQGIAPTDSP